jgi:hypothetical protein
MLFTYLVNTLELGSFVLLLLVIAYLLRGDYLHYPILLVYCLVELLTAGAEYLVSNFGLRLGIEDAHEFFIKLYYADEVIVDLLLFLMVITLTYRAMDGNPARVMAGRALGFITLAVLGLPFLLFHQSIGDHAVFMNGAGEVFNFGAAIMNLVLWTALIGARRRDAQLLTVCAGLGLQVTAQALGFGIRQLLPSRHRWMPDLFMTIAHLISVYIWWRAFRPASRGMVSPLTPAPREIHPGEV